jgi:two-component system chemotaxis sensor kinase CheA
MTFFDESFLEQLRETFNVEAQEHLQEMGNLLIQLEKKPAEQTKTEIIEKIFREAHSLKGAARSLNLVEVESICQALEDVFALMKEGHNFDSPEFFDVLHQAFEVTQVAVFDPQQNNSLRIVNIINELNKIANAAEKAEKATKSPSADRIVADKSAETSQNNIEASQTKTDEADSTYDIFEDEEFLNELKETFTNDAIEYLNEISEGLIALEKSEDAEKANEVLSKIYRIAHSLKGGAASLRFQDFANVCQEIESIFSLLKEKHRAYDAELFDVLHASVNLLNEYVKAIAENAAFPQQAEIAELLSQLKQQQRQLQQQPKPAKQLDARPVEEKQNSIAVEKPSPSKTKSESNGEVAAKPEVKIAPNPVPSGSGKNLGHSIRIPTHRLDQLMYQSEEMLVSKLSLARLKEHLSDSLQDIEQWRKEWRKIKPEAHFLNRYLQKSLDKPLQKSVYGKLDKILHFLQINEQNLQWLHNTLQHLVSHSEADYRQLSNSIDNLLEDAKKLLMLPAKTVTQLFPKLVRDLARSLEKDVDFEVIGDELEIDKRILEVIKDPLIHILRNCLDHGMETPDERKRTGKLPRGKVRLAFSQLDAGKIEIQISDDGRGLDPEKLKATAIRKGIISSADAMEMSDQEARQLIFKSQFSTAEIITDLSGRGLGMSIVREKIQDLGGYIQVQSEKTRGTTFKIVLPLTLSRFRGTLVKSGDQRYVFPTNNVLRVIRIKPEDISTVKNKTTITFDNQVIAFAHLNHLFATHTANGSEDPNNERLIQVLVVASGDKIFAFGCDQIVQEQEVVVKPFGKQIQRVKNFSGATVMGDGSVVLIVNVADLITTASKASTNHAYDNHAQNAQSKAKKSILVAEDSITTRTLMKHILEASGFDVQTAVDGAQALEFAQAKNFDLVVSDVEMPRLNGFLLTEALRSNPKTAEDWIRKN